MASLNLEELREIVFNVEGLKREDCDALMSAMQSALDEKKNTPKEKQEKPTKEWGVILDDYNNAFVVQVTDDEDGITPTSIQDAVDAAIVEYQNSVKKRKSTGSLEDAFTNVSKKYFKSKGILVKSTSPVIMEKYV